jgi:hypothetical protein
MLDQLRIFEKCSTVTLTSLTNPCKQRDIQNTDSIILPPCFLESLEEKTETGLNRKLPRECVEWVLKDNKGNDKKSCSEGDNFQNAESPIFLVAV